MLVLLCSSQCIDTLSQLSLQDSAAPSNVPDAPTRPFPALSSTHPTPPLLLSQQPFPSRSDRRVLPRYPLGQPTGDSLPAHASKRKSFAPVSVEDADDAALTKIKLEETTRLLKAANRVIEDLSLRVARHIGSDLVTTVASVAPFTPPRRVSFEGIFTVQYVGIILSSS